MPSGLFSFLGQTFRSSLTSPGQNLIVSKTFRGSGVFVLRMKRRTILSEDGESWEWFWRW